MRRKDCASTEMYARQCVGRRILAAAALLLAAPVPSLAQSIRMWESATVDGDYVRLSDIALLEHMPEDSAKDLATLLIARAPAAGSTDLISMTAVRQLLHETGVNLATTRLQGASRCAVHRPHKPQHTLPPAAVLPSGADDKSILTLHKLIRREVFRSLGESFDGQVELSMSGPAKAMLELTTPPYQFDIRAVGTRSKGPLEFEVTAHSAVDPPRTEQLSVFTRLIEHVVVAVRNINQGEIIKAEDVEQQDHVFTRPDQIGVGSLTAVVGQQAKRVIPAGKMIRTSDLKSVPLVRRNAIVLVTTTIGDLRVTLTGRALESGTLGEIIKLRNEASKEAFYARVIGLGLAEALSATDRAVGHPGERP